MTERSNRYLDLLYHTEVSQYLYTQVCLRSLDNQVEWSRLSLPNGSPKAEIAERRSANQAGAWCVSNERGIVQTSLTIFALVSCFKTEVRNSKELSTTLYVKRYVRFSFIYCDRDSISNSIINKLILVCVLQYCKKINNIIKGKQIAKYETQ